MALTSKVCQTFLVSVIFLQLVNIHAKPKDSGENETKPKPNKQVYCIVEGRRYWVYQKIISKKMPKCGRCYCSPKGKIFCEGPVCSSYCVDGTYKAGQCCPICPRGSNCHLGDSTIPAKQYVVENMGSGCTKICSCPGKDAYLKYREKTQADCKTRCTRNLDKSDEDI